MNRHRPGRTGPGLLLHTPGAASPGAPRHARPYPGQAVLACRCGTVLDLAELHRLCRPTGPRSGFRIEPVGCRSCAVGAR